tara:strand:+ start:715 stop:1200 length:486 start_codon:yes stop_codon:yes gene_type:complete
MWTLFYFQSLRNIRASYSELVSIFSDYSDQDAVTGKECAKEKSERRKDDAGSEDENEESGEDEESEEESGDENDQDSDEDNVMDNIEMKDGEESDSSDSEEGDDKKKKKKKAVSQETRVSAEDAIGSTPRKSREELRQLVQERIENMRKEVCSTVAVVSRD